MGSDYRENSCKSQDQKIYDLRLFALRFMLPAWCLLPGDSDLEPMPARIARQLPINRPRCRTLNRRKEKGGQNSIMRPTRSGQQALEKRILINTSYGHFMSHLNMLVFPAVVLPLTELFGRQMPQVLAMSFWMYLLFGATALPWGLAADRWGAGALMRIFYIGAGAAGMAAAFFLDNPSVFVLSLALLGLFSGIYHPTGLGLISKQVTRVSRGMGINGMFGNLGIAAAPLLAGVINWQWGPPKRST